MDDERYYFHSSGEDQEEDQYEEPEDGGFGRAGRQNEAARTGRRGRKNRRAVVFTGILAACVIVSIGYYGFKYRNLLPEDSSPAAKERLTLTEQAAQGTGENKKAAVLDVSDVVAETLPCVVAITNTSIQQVEYWFRTMEFENVISGSGFIIARTSEELLIATNAHVVEDASELSVCFTVEGAQDDMAAAKAVVKGLDEKYDLAVVSVKIADIPAEVRDQTVVAQLGMSSQLRVGEPAIAIGNALGYGQSVTLGIISALDREVEIDGTKSTLIQTDAAINEGNSGGVLLDVDGHVVGINSAKASAYGVERMGYAIPIDDAKPVLEELMNKVTRTKVSEGEAGYLGISPRDISEEGRSLYNMPEGVFVYEVEPGSPADQAGIKSGDVITRFDGNTVYSSEQLFELIEYYSSGEEIEIELQSVTGGIYETRTIEVTLG